MAAVYLGKGVMENLAATFVGKDETKTSLEHSVSVCTSEVRSSTDARCHWLSGSFVGKVVKPSFT
jgi:hypothetical protein